MRLRWCISVIVPVDEVSIVHIGGYRGTCEENARVTAGRRRGVYGAKQN